MKPIRATVTTWIILLLFILCAGTFIGCSGSPKKADRLHLFSISIGRLEDQLDLVQLPGQPFQNDVNIALRDGIFYVSDSRSRKIMQFNSYGDLLMLIYDQRVNPTPVLLSTEANDEVATNRKAVAYPFDSVGQLAVSSTGTVFVVDSVEESLIERDVEIGAILRSRVLRFNSSGTLEAGLGQEGVSGTPFPPVHGLYATADDGCVVVCRTSVDWRGYRFDDESRLVSSVSIEADSLPMPGESVIAAVSHVVPDPSSRRLIAMVDYFAEEADDVAFIRSDILVIDETRSEPVRSIQLPELRLGRNRTRLSTAAESPILYELLGMTEDGLIFCAAPLGSGASRVLILSSNGETVYLGDIALEDEEVLLRAFRVTPSGALTALVVEPLGANVFVWRFDQIIEESADEAR